MNHERLEKRSYDVEAMSAASAQLRAALYKYAPRPYPGNAFLLVNSTNAMEIFRSDAFWPNHLWTIQYEVLGSRHNDIFHEHLKETALFVRGALA